MKVYISGPIAGTEDYQERFAAAAERILSKTPMKDQTLYFWFLCNLPEPAYLKYTVDE